MVAAVMSGETGKPIAEARGEWSATADQFEWYDEETKPIYGQLIVGASGRYTRERDLPAGWRCCSFFSVVFPALLPARKIVAALAAGCSVILEPAPCSWPRPKGLSAASKKVAWP